MYPPGWSVQLRLCFNKDDGGTKSEILCHRFPMLSALYRCNPVLDIDVSCVTWLAKAKKMVDKGCQVWTSKVTASKSTQVMTITAKQQRDGEV